MPERHTIGHALQCAQDQIPPKEARLLLREASGLSDTTLIAFPERVISAEAFTTYQDWLVRRAAGEPIAYLIGWREFFGHRFRVTSATLIPRPDTEVLVETALARLATLPSTARILDLGTGSGAIAVSLALAAPQTHVTAVDASEDALAVAAENAQSLGASVRCLHGSWFTPVAGERFSLIVSNPPYIAQNDPHLAQGDLRFEPNTALAAAQNGLADLNHIIEQATQHLEPGGWLLLEHGFDQAPSVRQRLITAGFQQHQVWADLAGNARVSGGCWQP